MGLLIAPRQLPGRVWKLELLLRSADGRAAKVKSTVAHSCPCVRTRLGLPSHPVMGPLFLDNSTFNNGAWPFSLASASRRTKGSVSSITVLGQPPLTATHPSVDLPPSPFPDHVPALGFGRAVLGLFHFKLATEPPPGRARTRPSRRGTRPRAHSPTRLGSCPAAEIRSAVAVAAEESYLGPMHPSRCPALSSPFLFSSLFVRCSLVIPSPLRFPSLVSVVSLPLSIVEVESTFAFPVPRSVRP